MHLPPGEPPDGDRGVATPPTSDAAFATEIACDAQLDLSGADVHVADGIGHTNEPSADDGVDRSEYVVPLAAADDLADLQEVYKMDAVDMLQGTYSVLVTFGDSGVVYPRLRDRIAADGKRVLASWARYAPSRGWSPPEFFENMFRIGIVASLIQGGDIRGSVAVLALQDHADVCARRLLDCYAEFGVVEGAVLHRFETYETASFDRPEHLPFSEGALRNVSRVISLALIDMLTTSEFEESVLALIEDRLPNGKWPPLTRAVQPKRALALDPPVECHATQELQKALDTVPQVAAIPHERPPEVTTMA